MHADQSHTLDLAPGDRVEPTSAFAPGATIGHFRIVRELGAGGMGIVFEAHDPDLGRRVAIKVVRDRRAGSAAGLRLIAEAQAMARLGHPNVVAVHEVGTIDNQVFVVMELVRGETLTSWLGTTRPWREIVSVFVQAGEGLLAAHHAGLVHRDFKPSNVLIDLTGRPRVSDFGLAHRDDRPLATGSEPSGVAGTPAYMAPEQRAGEVVDARADQYAFAISLQQALAPKRVVGTPARRVRHAVARALSIDPDARFASMAELLAELRHALRSPRRMAFALGGIAAAGGIALALFATRAEADTCASGTHLVDDVWGPGARAAQLAGFARVRPVAAVASESTAHLVDDWAEGWKLGRRAACAVDGSQRDARLACLDRDLYELRAQVALWTSADGAIVDHAVQAAAGLPQPDTCATHPAAELAAPLRDRIAELSALLRSGRAKDANDGVPAMITLAEATANPRAIAAALLAGGRIERDAGKLQLARDHLSRAAREAGTAGDDALLLDALVEEAVIIIDLGRPRDALGLLDAAEALNARAHLDETERIAVARGDALGQGGRPDEAIAILTRVLPQIEARAARIPAGRMLLTTALGELAAAQIQIDKEAARKTLVRTLAIDQETYGPDHPEVAKTLHDLANAELQLRDLDGAEAHLKKALGIFVAAYGDRHPMVGMSYLMVAEIAIDRSQPDAARAGFEKARELLTGVVPLDSPQFAAIEEGIGGLDRAADHCKDAIPHFERALHILEETGHAEDEHAQQLTNLGACLSDVGRIPEARKALQRSLEELENLKLPNRWLSEPYAALADIEHGAGNRAKAIELETKALAAIEHEQGPDVEQMRSYEREQLASWLRSK